MLGGGNLARIPAVEAVWHQIPQAIASDPATLRRTIGIYDPPRGNPAFLDTLAQLLRHLLRLARWN